MQPVIKKSETSPQREISNTEIVAQEKGIVNFNIENLISQAVVAGTSIEGLKELLAMRKELKQEWAKEEFGKAMAKFQSEIGTIEKRKKVSFNTTSYSYAPLEDIIEQVKEPLARNGLSYAFDTLEAEKAIKVICYAKHIAGHTESSSLTIELDQTAKMNTTQKYGSANSYGKRYAFCNAFGILTGDEDNDAQSFKGTQKTVARDYSPTDEQLDYLRGLREKAGYSREELISMGLNPKSGLSVSHWIKELKGEGGVHTESVIDVLNREQIGENL